MKRHPFITPLFFMSATICATAQAQNTIEIRGEFIVVACTATLEGSASESGNVVLPEISENDLPAVGSTAGETIFTIKLTGCTKVSGREVSAKANFYSPGYATIDGRLNLAANSTGKGWQYQIITINKSGQAGVAFGGPPASAAYHEGAEVSSGSEDLQYIVRYYRAGAGNDFSVGSGHSQVRYMIYYD